MVDELDDLLASVAATVRDVERAIAHDEPEEDEPLDFLDALLDEAAEPVVTAEKPTPAEEPPAPEPARHGREVTLHEAMSYLAGRCDGARTLDGHGFDRMDTEIGHRLADLPYEKWSDRQRAWAFKRVRKYKRQFTEADFDWEHVPPPEPAPPRPSYEPIREIVMMPNAFGIRFAHLNNEEFQRVRFAVNRLQGVRWIYDREQKIPASVGFDSIAARQLRELAKHYGFTVDPEVEERFFHLIDKGQHMRELAMSVDAPDYHLGEAERVGPPTAEYPDGIRPWGHQRSFVRYAELAEWRVLLADEPGTGKTISAILGALKARSELGLTGRWLIACPKGVMRQWRAVLKAWAPELEVELLSGQGAPALIGVDILIANYDILRLNGDEELNDLLITLATLGNIDTLICDESHKLKNEQASRTRAMSEFVKLADPKVRFFLTGSPIPNRVREFIPQLDMLGLMKSHFGSKANFVREYAKSRDYKGLNDRLVEAGYMCRTTDHHAIDPYGKFLDLRHVPAYVLSKDLVEREATEEDREQRKPLTAEIRAHLERYGYTFLEGALRLKGRFPKPAPVDLDDWNAYAFEHSQTQIWMKQMASELMDDPEAFARWLRAYALVRINKLRLSIARKKLKEAKPYIEDLLMEGEKVVVAVQHSEIVEGLVKHFKGAAVIQGGQSSKLRDDEKQRFMDDPECRLMILQIESGGEGLDGMQLASCNIVFLEYPWNPGKLDQAERRLYRGGQRHPVICHYVVANPDVMQTIDQYMLEIIDAKKADTTAAQHGADAPEDAMLMAVVNRFLGHEPSKEEAA